MQKINTMDHPTLLMKIIEWCKGVETLAGLSVGCIVGWIHFLDIYLLSDPSYWVATSKAFFTAVLTGIGAFIGTASGKWLVKICKEKIFKKKNTKP